MTKPTRKLEQKREPTPKTVVDDENGTTCNAFNAPNERVALTTLDPLLHRMKPR